MYFMVQGVDFILNVVLSLQLFVLAAFLPVVAFDGADQIFQVAVNTMFLVLHAFKSIVQLAFFWYFSIFEFSDDILHLVLHHSYFFVSFTFSTTLRRTAVHSHFVIFADRVDSLLCSKTQKTVINVAAHFLPFLDFNEVFNCLSNWSAFNI